MTTVSPPLGLNPDGATVLLGYTADLGLFAGFDLSRHRHFTPGSSSVQIDINTVRQALHLGLSFDRKSNDEIAIGIRPDQLVNYINNAEDLHRYGRFTDTFNLLNKVTALDAISQADIESLASPRRRVVETVSRLSRTPISASGSCTRTAIGAPSLGCSSGLSMPLISCLLVLAKVLTTSATVSRLLRRTTGPLMPA